VPRLKNRPALRPLTLAAAMTLACLAGGPSQALDVFTGARPVYLGSWYNGSFTEVREFQFALDWQGWCNSHIGSNCQSITYWNVAGNWDGNAIPNALSGDARVEAGRTVRVGGLNSVYLGFIPDFAKVNTLSAQGRVEISSQLSVANASFADLYMYSFAKLDTTGQSTVLNLSSGLGEFSGVGGITQLQGWQPNTLGRLDLLVKTGHRLELAADAPATQLQIRLEPTVQMRNIGTLRSGGGSIGLQGTANPTTLPTFTNAGSLSGSLSLDGVRFNNSGSVQLGQDEHIHIGPVGDHTGSFIGGINSWISFGGFAGVGHHFGPPSSVVSSGQVFAGRGRHVVSGSWNVARTQVDSGGNLTFDGLTPSMDELRVTGNLSRATINPAVQLQDLLIDDLGAVSLVGGPSQTQRLVLSSGGLDVNGLRVAQRFDWHSGYIGGAGPLRLPAQTTLHDGGRTLATSVLLDGRLDWEGGSFGQWSGAFTVLPTGRFVLAGDFNSAGGGGSITNFGIIEKTAGTGRATWGMGVHSNGGLTKVQSGVLAWTGGGTHLDATFEIASGAALELSGGTVFGGSVTKTGKLEIVGGSFELLAGTAYSHGSGHRFEPGDVQVRSGANLYLPDPVRLGGNVGIAGILRTGNAITVGGSMTNTGQFLPGSNVSIDGGFYQNGVFVLPPGASLYVGAFFDNNRALTLSNSPLIVGGSLYNNAPLTLDGAINAQINDLRNSSTLHLQPTPGANTVWIGQGDNNGTLRVDGAQLDVNIGGAFVNNGSIVNEGFWRVSGGFGPGGNPSSFVNQAGSHFDNRGALDIDGRFVLGAGSRLTNGGGVHMTYGELLIEANASLEGMGPFAQADGTTIVNGLLRAPMVQLDGGVLKGTGTIQGNVIVGPFAAWRPGTSPGTQTVLGDAVVWGDLDIEVQSLAVHDRLVVSGSFAMGGGRLNLLFDAGFTPTDGDTIAWLQTAPGTASVYGNVQVQGLASGFDLSVDPISGRIELLDLAAVQIPASGQYTVPVGTVAMNAVIDPNNPPNLDLLRVEGRFSNRSGTTPLYINTLQNTGSLRNRGAMSVYEWSNDGQFSSGPGSTFSGGQGVNRGQLELLGTSDIGRLDNEAGATLRISGHLQSPQPVWNRGSLTLAGRWDATGEVLNTSRFVIEPGAVLHIRSSSFGDFITQDEAADLVVNGLLDAPRITIYGRLSGSGTLRGDVRADFAEINPGNSPGTLTIEGDLLAPLGTLVLELASTQSFDRLVVSGNADIGFVRFVLPADFRPVAGDSFTVLAVGGTLSGQALNGNWRVEAPDPYSSGYYIWADSLGIRDPYNPQPGLRVSFDGGTLSVTAVPEPSGWALLLGGLAALRLWQQRRAARSTPLV